jgi:DNA-binding NtrC family response regulator
MALELLVQRGTQSEGACPIVALPLRIGAGAGCDLRLEGAGVRELHGEVLVSEAGGLVYRPTGRGKEVALAPGKRFRVGPFQVKLVLQGGGGGLGVDPDRPLEAVLDILPRLRGEEADPPGLVLEALRRGFDASWGALLRVEEGEQSLLREEGAREPAAGTCVSRTVLGELASGDGPVLAADVRADPALAGAGSIPTAVHSVLAARLELPGEPLAAIYLESPASRRCFTPGERLLLERLATLAADALVASGEARELRRGAARAAERNRRASAGPGLVGGSTATQGLREDLEKAAATDVTVLVLGETGTGKELVAREIHRGSGRASGPFVAVNCAAIPVELAESELFGHRAGAFSGASADRMGRFELASSGTLFLDEIGELPLELQPKLLRALEERAVVPVGEDASRPVDVRLVVATHRDLPEAVDAGEFRADLFYRLAVYTVRTTPLRERTEDVGALSEHLLERFARAHGERAPRLGSGVLDALVRYPWPGNVRELSNVLEAAWVRSQGEEITLEHLAFSPAAAGDEPAGYDAARRAFEERFFRRHLRELGGDTAAVASRVGLSRSQVYRKCQDLGLGTGRTRARKRR